MNEKKKAIVLLSGGLDSATCLAIARSQGFDCHALSFAYGQRHGCELEMARKTARHAGLPESKHVVIEFDLRKWGGSALTSDIPVPAADGNFAEVPITYVPARNLVFLSFAVAWAETLKCRDIFIGVNSVDYSGYPDCRKAFIDSFAETARLGTKAVDENWRFTIHSPLQSLSKGQIIRKGLELGVDYASTTSCYNPDEKGRSCGYCDSCFLRKNGFEEAGVPDPTVYFPKV